MEIKKPVTSVAGKEEYSAKCGMSVNVLLKQGVDFAVEAASLGENMRTEMRDGIEPAYTFNGC